LNLFHPLDWFKRKNLTGSPNGFQIERFDLGEIILEINYNLISEIPISD
jgi:hypothetical protein